MRSSIAALAMAIALTAGVVMPDDAGAQVGYLDARAFTDEELFEAFRVGASDAEARRRVADLRRSDSIMSAEIARFRADTSPDRAMGPGEISPAFGSTLSEDTLIILSLLGAETEAKVRRYIAARMGGREADAEYQRAWRERSEELRPWVEEVRRKRPPEDG